MSLNGTMEGVAAAGRPRLDWGRWSAPIVVAGAWLALIAATSIYRHDFLSHQTLLAVTFTMSVVGVLAIGQGLVAISGGFLDLSQPSNLILSSLVVIRLSEAGMPLPVLFVAGILTGMAWGLVNAAIIVFGKLNPVIVTLSTNFIGIAALYLIFQLAQVPNNSDIYYFGRASFLGLPAIWWPMLALILIVGVFMQRTRFGRRATAGGGNRFAAQVRGISLRKTRFAVFTIAGGFVGFTSILFVSAAGPIEARSADLLLLNVIAAVIVGGIALSGGRGHFWMLILSVGLLSTVPTSLVFFGLDSDSQAIFQGLILVVAVALDGYRSKKGTP